MTTTRIDHTGHNHPSTTAARTACRKALAATPVVAPVFHLVAIGNGKVRHQAVMADDTCVGARCGAGLQRGLRKASTMTHYTSDVDDVNCNRCRY
jgi:hypothetical protein